MPSDFTLNVDMTDEQKEAILEEYRESDLTPIEYYLQERVFPSALDSYLGLGDDDE